MLGGNGVPSYDNFYYCKCPAHDDERASLSIKDVSGGRLFWCFANCITEDIIAAINRQYKDGRLDRSRQVQPELTHDAYDPMISVQRALAGSEADAPLRRRFYRDHRSITLPLPAVLRSHPSLYHKESDTFGPAIIAPVCDLVGGVRGLYRLWLDPETGAKAKLDPVRKMLGQVGGHAVHLIGRPDEGETLYVAEGIENALAYVEISDLGGLDLTDQPGTLVWSALSAPGIAKLIVPERVCEVIVLLDKDEAALSAVNTLSQRLRAQHHRAHVSVRTPLSDPPGNPKDFNDMLMLIRPPRGARA
jgi:hypothetical protein